MTDRSDALWHGLVAGLIGYVVFALYFGVINIVAGRSPLFTVNALGAGLFDLGSPEGPPSAAPILAYNAVHLLASIITGTAASFLLFTLERRPAVWYIVTFLFLVGLIYAVAIGGIVGREVTGAVSWTHVAIVNVLAAFAAGTSLWRAHPHLHDRVRRAAD